MATMNNKIRELIGANSRTKIGKNDGNKRGYYVSMMEDAENEAINALTTTKEKLELVALLDIIAEECGMWRKENFTDNTKLNYIGQTQRSKFANMKKHLKKKIITGWSKADYEYACWCLWFLDELKNEKGDVIIYQHDELYDLQCDLLEKTTEGIVDDYINAERRYNWVMLGKFVHIE